MTDILWAILTTFALTGVLAYALHKRRINNLTRTHEEQLTATDYKAFSAGHDAGWKGALRSPYQVKTAYEEMFKKA